MAWHWVDIVIAAIIALSVITGLFRGFIKELIALCIWILAIWLAITYTRTISPWFEAYIHDQTVCFVVAFVAILLVTIILGGVCNAVLSYILTRSGLSGTDRILGMAFGFVRGVFIVSLLMLVVKMTSIPHEAYAQQSLLYSKFEPIVNWLQQFTPAMLQRIKGFHTDKPEIDKSDLKPS